MGSSLPPASQAQRDSALLKKMKRIFSIASVESLEKSWEYFSLEKHSSNASSDAAPDALCESGAWHFWGVHTGPAHSNVSESGDERPVIHYRSARGI